MSLITSPKQPLQEIKSHKPLNCVKIIYKKIETNRQD